MRSRGGEGGWQGQDECQSRARAPTLVLLLPSFYSFLYPAPASTCSGSPPSLLLPHSYPAPALLLPTSSPAPSQLLLHSPPLFSSFSALAPTLLQPYTCPNPATSPLHHHQHLTTCISTRGCVRTSIISQSYHLLKMEISLL